MQIKHTKLGLHIAVVTVPFTFAGRLTPNRRLRTSLALRLYTSGRGCSASLASRYGEYRT